MPLIYVLACEKKTDTYEQIFNALLNIKPDIKPKHITIDFEQAAINAIRKCFPESQIHACYFHFSQNIWKHIQQLGMQTKYAEDTEFAHNIRLLLALPFVPLSDVDAAFQEIASSDFFSENDSEYNTQIQTLLNYIEATYMGTYNRRGVRKNPLFPMEIWNVHMTTLEGLARTNNNVEGWHNAFSSFVGQTHPNIFKFIEALKKEQNLQDFKFAQVSASQPAEPRRKKYRSLDDRLKKIVENYDKEHIIEFLRSIAHNVVF